MAKHNDEERTLTRAEMEVMNILWDSKEGMSTHAIIERYPDPKPVYSTIATFMKILTNKGFICGEKAEGAGKTFFFRPLITREEYTKRFMKEVKSTFFGNSLNSLISFFAKEENVSDEKLDEILSLINSKH